MLFAGEVRKSSFTQIELFFDLDEHKNIKATKLLLLRWVRAKVMVWLVTTKLHFLAHEYDGVANTRKGR